NDELKQELFLAWKTDVCSACVEFPGSEESSEEVTEVVCLESDLQDGQMMEVEVGRQTVLLARTEGKYSAIGNQCTHYGAPLSQGVLSGHRLYCPWHGSCFNVLTGDVEEFPGMDCLPCHKVQSLVFRLFSIVSIKYQMKITGAASLSCAEILRQEHFGGRIIIVTKDDLLPYDKTRLSKVHDSIVLRKSEFFHQYDIEVWLRKEALSVDTDRKSVTFNDGSVHSYDQLLISTGSKGLDVPGRKLKNVMMLETPEDARRIHSACVGANVVVVGTSFVGMEVASYLIDKAIGITVIGSSELPYQNTLGREIGKMLSEKEVLACIVLKSGKVIPTDVLIVGIGSYPNSQFLQGSKVKMDSKNFVLVDKFMRTNVPDVFCGGDLAIFPLVMAKNHLVNIGHWQMAQAHGRIAALNMMNNATELASVPFYWTVLLGKTIRYAGHGEGYTEIAIKGTFEEQKFLVLYIKEDVVIAAASLNYDPAVSAVAERLVTGRVITKKEAQSDDLSWLQLS
uniref:Apoptosis-inducing factor 3-like n=1 Tax=Gouania willdenowi TaxID=441366 RepID=A0A8C5N899_GOUWI